MTRIVMIVAVILAIPLADAIAVQLQITPFDDGVTIRCTWPTDVEMQYEVDGRELYLHVNLPISLGNRGQEQLLDSDWVEAISLGYDSILLRAARQVRYEVEHRGSSIFVRMNAKPASHDSLTATARLQLDLLRVRLLIARRQFEDAERLLNQVDVSGTPDARIVGTRADLESARENRRLAKDLYEQALQLDPDNEFYRRAQSSLLRAQQPHLHSSTEKRSVHDVHDETRIGLSGDFQWNDALELFFATESNDIEDAPVRVTNGSLDVFSGVRRRHEVGAAYETQKSTVLRGGVSLFEKRWGAWWQQRHRDPRGIMEGMLEINRPWWETVDGAVLGACRDRLHLRRVHRQSVRMEWLAGGSASRYSTPAHSNAARTLALEAEVHYQITRSLLTATYGFDAEYVHKALELEDGGGLSYRPLPLYSREVHWLTLSLQRVLQRDWSFSGFGGFAWDRLGGSGPFTGAELRWDPLQLLNGRLWVDYRMDASNTQQRVLRMGAKVQLTL